MKNRLFALILFVSSSFAFAQNFSKGEELFRQNKPEEAVPFLVAAMDANENPKVYEYLSLSYFQLGMYDEGFAVVNSGLKVSGTDKKLLALNAGNIAYIQGNYQEADRWYSLSISANPSYSSPVLNRANARVYEGKLSDAQTDYRKFLELAPDDPRKPDILAMIDALNEEIAFQAQQEKERQEEAARLAEEEKRMQEEMAKAEAEAQAERERLAAEQAAEQARLAEEEAERKRKLLEEVAASLQEAETTSISAGAEDIIDYGYESELE